MQAGPCNRGHRSRYSNFTDKQEGWSICPWQGCKCCPSSTILLGVFLYNIPGAGLIKAAHIKTLYSKGVKTASQPAAMTCPVYLLVLLSNVLKCIAKYRRSSKSQEKNNLWPDNCTNNRQFQERTAYDSQDLILHFKCTDKTDVEELHRRQKGVKHQSQFALKWQELYSKPRYLQSLDKYPQLSDRR